MTNVTRVERPEADCVDMSDLNTAYGPEVRWSDIDGCDAAVATLKRVVASKTEHSDLYKLIGAGMPHAYLLDGLDLERGFKLARVVANEMGASFEANAGPDFVRQYVGQACTAVREMFNLARKKVGESGKPHVIFLGDLEVLGVSADAATLGEPFASNLERERYCTVAAMCQQIDALTRDSNIVVIAASKRVDAIDELLLRRFSRLVG